MKNFEQPAEERKHKEPPVDLREYRGDLHTHHQDELGAGGSPDKIVAGRGGSNCGNVALTVLAEHQLEKLGHLFLGVTDHSRDPAAFSEKVKEDVTQWFYKLYLNDDQWLQKTFGEQKTKQNLTDDEKKGINTLASNLAEELINYDDGRLKANLQNIDHLAKDLGNSVRLFKGVEVNLMPNGSFDTEMVERGEFELVNVSFHPGIERDKEGNLVGEPADLEIVKDPKKLSDLFVTGIKHPKTNIICHIGYGVPDYDVVKELDWERIAEAAIGNQVAIEINLKVLMDYIYKEILDYKKYPAGDVSYRKKLRDKLPALVPIISDPAIAERLKPFFAQGLKITINTDLHKLPDLAKKEEEPEKAAFSLRNIKYWRSLKIVEQYFNELFKELGIGPEHIINTYDVPELEKFLGKEPRSVEGSK